MRERQHGKRLGSDAGAVTWAADVMPHQLYSAEDVLAAELAGDLSIADDPVAQFVCPVIPMRGNH